MFLKTMLIGEPLWQVEKSDLGEVNMKWTFSVTTVDVKNDFPS